MCIVGRLLLATRLLPVVLLALATPAHGFFDDFESGTTTAWRASSTVGASTQGVEVKNGSKMAFVVHVGDGTNALTIDLPFVPGDYLAFEMLAVAVSDGFFGASSGAGATISFTDVFNVEIGRIGFFNLVYPASPPPKTLPIDQQQHVYRATMREFATRAGVPATAAIAKVSLSFSAWATTLTGLPATGTVHFDNVIVSSFDPALECLFGWAERSYPGALAPSGAKTAFAAPFTYRFYATSDSYVGVSATDNHVYYLDSRRTLHDLGELPRWLATAGCRF